MRRFFRIELGCTRVRHLCTFLTADKHLNVRRRKAAIGLRRDSLRACITFVVAEFEDLDIEAGRGGLEP